MNNHFIKLYRYNNWANKKILEVILSNDSVPDKSLKYFTHILIAEKTWMIRIKGEENPPQNFWPELNKNDFGKIINKNTDEYLELINNSNDKGFEEKIIYKNSKGIEFFTPLKDILTHVSTHSAYHRGQINAELRNAGIEPVLTDYIAFTRL